ncbi:MAG: methyltransferase domain-containing protein [Desulfobacteraceae bacterium]|nr:MAG: methyltransferase domain-containing protein [Desulfobacteraceae bacterium]
MEIIKRLKAISDETRLRILFVLLQYELNVNEIVSVIGMIQSGVSRHLKILMESGLLASRKDGSFIYYSAVENGDNQRIIEVVRHALQEEPRALQDIRGAEQAIQDRLRRTKIFFRDVAKDWDTLKRQVIGGLDLDQIIEEKVSGCNVIADLGCGTGELLERLDARTSPQPTAQLIGVDSSVEMLDLARSRLSGSLKVNLRLGELEHLPMRNEEVQCIIMNMVLHHISTPRDVILEASRVMAQGGAFILSEFEQHDNEKVRKIMGGAWLGLDSGKIRSWLERAGFECRSQQTHAVNHGLQVNIFSSIKR